ncbi:MAG TPA: aspartate-semialdehyde dehydrogenase [Dehalococcoidia bacterium]|nr:aspartate-semialdehyde dehydrogenase [Dehalococcoidia bacterium]
MAKKYNVAVVGATGVVGEEFLRILPERGFPLGSLKLIASQRSAGKKIAYGEDVLEVEALSPSSFEGCDLAFISATDEISREYAPIAAKAGAIVIDDSGVWRMDPEVPLVVPEINGDDVANHKGILAIPNCSTTPVVMTLWPLHQLNPVRRVIVATYQSVSGTGREAVEELEAESRASLAGEAVTPHVYPHRIDFNLIPEIGSWKEDGYTSEEMKLVNETRKIMHAPEIAIAATCVRVPVFVSHSAAVFAEFERPMALEQVWEVLGCAPGVVLQDDPQASLYPQPRAAAGTDPVYVGRIRRDISHPNGIAYWVVGDNLRKGAALNAIQIAEELIARSLI